MLNFNPEQTLKLLARRRLTRPNVARKPWEWSAAPDSAADPGASVAAAAIGVPSAPEPKAQPIVTSAGNGRTTVDLNPGSPSSPILTLDDTPLRRNQRSIERHINEDHYRRIFAPGTAILEGTATVAVLGTPRFAVISFPNDGTTSAAHWTFTRPSEWVQGKVAITVWFSSPVGSTNVFRIFVQIITVSTGEVTTAATLNLSVNLDQAGPAVADTLIEAVTIYTPTSIGRSDDLIGVRIGRVSGNAADTNVNALHFYVARGELVLGMQEVT